MLWTTTKDPGNVNIPGKFKGVECTECHSKELPRSLIIFTQIRIPINTRILRAVSKTYCTLQLYITTGVRTLRLLHYTFSFSLSFSTRVQIQNGKRNYRSVTIPPITQTSPIDR